MRMLRHRPEREGKPRLFKRGRMTIGAYVFAGVALVAILPLAILLGINERAIRTFAENEIGRMSRAVAHAAAESSSILLEPVLYELNGLAAALEDPRYAGNLDLLLSRELGAQPFLESLLVIDRNGYSIFSTSDNPSHLGQFFGESSLFKHPRDFAAPYFSDSFLSMQTRRPTAAISVASESGMVIVGTINLERLSPLVGGLTRELDASVRILDDRGIVMAGPVLEELLNRTSFKPLVEAAEKVNWGMGAGYYYTRDGKAYIAFSCPVNRSPWRTLVSFREEEIESLPAFIRERVILDGAAALLLSILAGWIFWNGINRSLGKLVFSVRDMASGSSPVDSTPRSHFKEMDDLLGEFADMRRQVYLREEELKGALASRDTLLKEIHHRVKNNLQIIASLLALQRERISNPEAYMALSESAQRVHSLSLVHEKLYQSSDFATLNLGDYLQDFCRGLLDTFNAFEDFDFEAEIDTISVDIDIAIPVGMCVNEILSNSIKYGRPEEGRGHLRMALKAEGLGFLLELSDSGPGFDPAAARKSGSLGLLLIDSLVEQIHGTLHIDVSAGSKFVMHVPRTINRA